jgi:hypothetical protein
MNKGFSFVCQESTNNEFFIPAASTTKISVRWTPEQVKLLSTDKYEPAAKWTKNGVWISARLSLLQLPTRPSHFLSQAGPTRDVLIFKWQHRLQVSLRGTARDSICKTTILACSMPQQLRQRPDTSSNDVAPPGQPSACAAPVPAAARQMPMPGSLSAGVHTAAEGSFAGVHTAAEGSFAGFHTAAEGSFAGFHTAAEGSFAGFHTAAEGMALQEHPQPQHASQAHLPEVPLGDGGAAVSHAMPSVGLKRAREEAPASAAATTKMMRSGGAAPKLQLKWGPPLPRAPVEDSVPSASLQTVPRARRQSSAQPHQQAGAKGATQTTGRSRQSLTYFHTE